MQGIRHGFRHGPEPLDYLFDLSTPGYVVEFTWRTGGVREIFHGREFGPGETL